jgi:hypothetical protein
MKKVKSKRKKVHHLGVRLSKAEIENLRKMCEKNGISPSVWVRKLILDSTSNHFSLFLNKAS